MEERADAMARNMTLAEEALYMWLHEGPEWFGFPVEPQAVIGQYIVDFLMPEVCIAVEVDGEGHGAADSRARDRGRTRHLKRLLPGLRVMRFTDERVLINPERVAWSIRRACRKAYRRKGLRKAWRLPELRYGAKYVPARGIDAANEWLAEQARKAG
jgi:very-short-patch-repair endonuclease